MTNKKEMLFDVLDVGCGSSPRGNVNCDLFMGETPHLPKDTRMINCKRIPNFVCCDAVFLPFRTNGFLKVISSHLLEHLEKPSKALIEMYRVSKNKVVFIVPHRYAKQQVLHINFFNYLNVKKWVYKLFGIFPIIEVCYRGFPHIVFPLFMLPYEIRAEFVVK